MRAVDCFNSQLIEDWLFFKDQQPMRVPQDLDHAFSIRYSPVLKGPLQKDELLQPFAIFNSVEWEQGKIALGSAVGFRAGDARFFFRGETVELVGRRVALDMRNTMPIYWEMQLFSNNCVVLSYQKFTEYGEPVRVTEVYNQDEPEKLKFRSYFTEKRYCDFCVARNTICECHPSLRDRSLQPMAVFWNKWRSQNALQITSVNETFHNFVRHFFRTIRRCTWNFVIEACVENSMMQISADSWTVEYSYDIQGDELEAMQVCYVQERILQKSPPKIRQIALSEAEENMFAGSGPSSQSLRSPNSLSSNPSRKHSSRKAVSGHAKCTMCDAVFGRVYEMKRHIASVHMMVREFACDRCPKTFSQKCHLTKHIYAVHEDIRNVPCPACDLKFRTKCKARRHYKAVHLNLRPNVCEECGSCFQQKSDVRRHIIAKHPGLVHV